MKALNYFATAVLALGLSSIPALSQVQQQQDPQQQPTQSQAGQAGDQQQSQQVQAFTGKIMKTNDGYVLQDNTGTSYKLDNEKQAKKFEGKDVKVTGTLDVATNTIHISNVEMASASY